MKKYAKKIAADDNVATAVVDFSTGDTATVRLHGSESTCRCNQDIPFGHKIALIDISQGEKIVKYGEVIGSAKQDIRQGDWVHTHNVSDDYQCLGKDGKPLPGQ